MAGFSAGLKTAYLRSYNRFIRPPVSPRGTCVSLDEVT